jgi:Zinc knuckle
MCYKCRQMGHMARNCKAPFNINAMSYDALKDYFASLRNQEPTKEEKNFQ